MLEKPLSSNAFLPRPFCAPPPLLWRPGCTFQITILPLNFSSRPLSGYGPPRNGIVPGPRLSGLPMRGRVVFLKCVPAELSASKRTVPGMRRLGRALGRRPGARWGQPRPSVSGSYNPRCLVL